MNDKSLYHNLGASSSRTPAIAHSRYLVSHVFPLSYPGFKSARAPNSLLVFQVPLKTRVYDHGERLPGGGSHVGPKKK